jgi:hypothetical protein
MIVSPLYVSFKQDRPTSAPPPNGRTRSVLNSAAAEAAESATRLDIKVADFFDLCDVCLSQLLQLEIGT